MWKLCPQRITKNLTIKRRRALKEAEIVAELAPDEETRKEAEELIETVETQEMFDTYKQGVLKFTERVSKYQPLYAQSISKLTARIHTTDKRVR